MSALSLARTAAIEQLRRDHAFRGAREGGIALNGVTGDLVEYVVGEEFSVNFTDEKLAGYERLVVLHTHPRDNPANEWDWQWLAEHLNVIEFIVVTPTRTFVVQRPPGWQLAAHWQLTPFDDWQGHALNILLERGLTSSLALTTDEWADIECEANRRMARQFQMTFFEETP